LYSSLNIIRVNEAGVGSHAIRMGEVVCVMLVSKLEDKRSLGVNERII
jgi:hypothetical protein